MISLLAISCFLVGSITAEIDSGGGAFLIGSMTNHSSIGSPFATGNSKIGANENKSGLIQVLFTGNIDPDLDADANGLPGVAVNPSTRTANERLPENDNIGADFCLFSRPPYRVAGIATRHQPAPVNRDTPYCGMAVWFFDSLSPSSMNTHRLTKFFTRLVHTSFRKPSCLALRCGTGFHSGSPQRQLRQPFPPLHEMILPGIPGLLASPAPVSLETTIPNFGIPRQSSAPGHGLRRRLTPDPPKLGDPTHC